VTTVLGLDGFGGVKLADAAKLLAKRFACGAAVVKGGAHGDEIDIQGDVRDELVDYLHEKFAIPIAAIFFLDGKDKHPARL
jgi:density-regulated protein DRP1